MQHKTIKRLIDSHPLAFLMIIEAARQFSAEAAATTPADYPPRGLVNPESWIEAAQSIQKALA
jgi:hypothetical protein